ncbi:MAG: 2OG-Fe(II) oxygenase, partial [Alphaproteobacteria bacterium]|nr:2OG-Fe(II) oxygenase [Alphaproteobacteria bacterium]
ADWRRDAALGCTCATCRELAGFLDDPARNMWSLRASEERRSHVEEMVRRSGSDLDLRTERKGRPYTLVCVKNQGSYQRRLVERRRDLENARLLEPKSP